jgi:2-oxoglutarate ferredoxin oxidoreductase subunit beta
MASLLNETRPPVFCPGCSHERVARALDQCFESMCLKGHQIAIVSDIGCSGLFDTFFHTHALHGLHGRALTYATGLKMAQPELTVVVTMGDGGMGIGGAHLLSACRRNLDITLLVMNNFNFGMTGGQFSATTPTDARLGSGFLNRLEHPMDLCRLSRSAGASYVARCSSSGKGLSEEIEKAIRHEGFSVLDIWGICPGRYTKRNKLTPRMIEENIARLPLMEGMVPDNMRKEYGRQYREAANSLKPVPPPVRIERAFDPPEKHRREFVILGSAGQRIITAGEILCLSGLVGGLNVTQKNEYNITVLRGPSISEVILSPEQIGYTGIEKPDIILALGQDGVDRRATLFDILDEHALIVQLAGVALPPHRARIHRVDFRAQKIKGSDWALAALSVMAKLKIGITFEMLQAALAYRLKGQALVTARDLICRVVCLERNSHTIQEERKNEVRI